MPAQRSPATGTLENAVRHRHNISTAQPGARIAGRMRRFRSETLSERAFRYRGVILIASLLLFLISFLLLLMPRKSFDIKNGPFKRSTIRVPTQSNRYAVVFDAGSSGSRVHVFCFSNSMELLPIGNEVEFFLQKKPGLGAFSSNATKGAESLKPLLEAAINVVPDSLHSTTPVRVGATAGLRTLPGESAIKLLYEVESLLKQSPLKFSPGWVTILDGTEEGAFEWITINYLLGNIGKSYGETVGVIDLGGGSVQMAYAISDEEAQVAPKSVKGDDAYIMNLTLLSKTYHLYVHSYLHYGLLAARAEMFKLIEPGSSCPCIPSGFQGEYRYGTTTFNVFGENAGSDFDNCRELAVKALKKDDTCDHIKCTFQGVWNGGGGDGQRKLFVASFFFDRAVEAGIIDNPEASEAKIKPSDLEKVGKSICATRFGDIGQKYPRVEESHRAYFCLDIAYQYALLVEGFDINPNQEVTLVKKIKYKNSFVEAAWSLGSAIEIVSRFSSFLVSESPSNSFLS